MRLIRLNLWICGLFLIVQSGEGSHTGRKQDEVLNNLLDHLKVKIQRTYNGQESNGAHNGVRKQSTLQEGGEGLLPGKIPGIQGIKLVK